MRTGAGLLILCSTALWAGEHAYTPDKAWLVHATSKWLVWEPDDKGASLEKPKKKKEDGLELELPPLPAGPPKMTRVFVLQRVTDAKQLHTVRVQWKLGLHTPFLDPVTALEDGTLVLSDRDGQDLHLYRPDGTSSERICWARKKAAALVAAYPDGIVVQVPRPDVRRRPYNPREPFDPDYNDAHLYWVPTTPYGFDSKKASRMTPGKGTLTRYLLRVARSGDKIAVPGAIFSLKSKKRRKSDWKWSGIQTFDGRKVVGRPLPGQGECFVARDGIRYLLEKGSRGTWIIRARRPGDDKMFFTFGEVSHDRRDLSPHFHRRASTLAVRGDRTRLTIYWNETGLTWSEGNEWRHRGWLTPADFKK